MRLVFMLVFMMVAWIVLLCGYPILIACLWLTRLRQGEVTPLWRGVMSWISISLATAALGAWTATLTNIHQATIERPIGQLLQGVNTSLTFSASAVVTAFLAKGKGRGWTAASALLVPLYFSLGMLFGKLS